MMRVSKTAAALAALGLVAVAGCSKGGGAAANTAPAAGAGGAPAAAAAPASGPDTPIAAADVPHLKSGYWETSTSTNGRPPETNRFCSSGKPFTPPKGNGHAGCAGFSFKRTFLGAIVIDTACAEGPVASKMHMTVSGDFNSSFTSDAQATITMQGRPATTFTTHSVTRYLGPCPAGEKPADD